MMAHELMRFVKGALQRGAALIEERGTTGLDVLLPADTAGRLALPEYVSFEIGVDPRECPDTAVPISYMSELLEPLHGIVGDSGRHVRRAASGSIPKPERVRREALSAFQVERATLRFLESTEAWVPYSVLHFHMRADSDERREDFFSVAACGTYRSAPQGVLDAPVATGDGDAWTGPAAPPGEGGEREDPEETYRTLHRMAGEQARSRLQPFVSAMERRLARDLQRLSEYYETLKSEGSRRRRAGGEDVGAPRKTASEPRADVERARVIDAEHRRKVDDLLGKYTVRVSLEPVSALRLVVRAVVCVYEIRRRKEHVPVSLPWNTITRKMDLPLCDGCCTPHTLLTVCNHFHKACHRCFSECASCGKAACLVCGKGRCPSCGADPTVTGSNVSTV